MTPHERRIAHLLAEAGISGVAHLSRIVNSRHRRLVSEATVRRYLYEPWERRMEFKVVMALAEALEVPAGHLYAILKAEATRVKFAGKPPVRAVS